MKPQIVIMQGPIADAPARSLGVPVEDDDNCVRAAEEELSCADDPVLELLLRVEALEEDLDMLELDGPEEEGIPPLLLLLLLLLTLLLLTVPLLLTLLLLTVPLLLTLLLLTVPPLLLPPLELEDEDELDAPELELDVYSPVDELLDGGTTVMDCWAEFPPVLVAMRSQTPGMRKTTAHCPDVEPSHEQTVVVVDDTVTVPLMLAVVAVYVEPTTPGFGAAEVNPMRKTFTVIGAGASVM